MTSGSTIKLLEIVRFELVYQFRRRSTWILFALFLFLLWAQTNGQVVEARSREILFNAPLMVAQISVTMSLVALLVIAAVAGDAATRDVRTRLEPLIHAAPVGRAVYLGGRFLGAFIVSTLLLAAVPLALLLAPLVHPGIEAELVGPFRPAAYLQSYFLLIVPNAFMATALLFALATLARHTLGSYIGAALVFTGTVFCRGFVGVTLGRWDLAQQLDSTGLSALTVMARTWSPADLNARLIGSEGALLWNRLLWLALAFAVLAFLCTRFRYGGSAGNARWRRRIRPGAESSAGGVEAAAVARSAPVTVPRVPRDFGVAGRIRQMLTIARDSLREMTTGWSWLVLPLLVFLVAINQDLLKVKGTPILPTTGRVLDTFVGALSGILVFTALFAGELVWRERDANMQALADATPVADGVRFAGKLLGLWLMIVALHALLMLAGLLIQVRLGWYHFDLPLYAQVLFGLDLLQPLVFALIALSVHVLVNQKHVGHLVVLLLVWAASALPSQVGIEHPLLRYGATPDWYYSAISGLGPFVGPVLWLALYWAAWTLLLAIVARFFWVRGVELGVGERLRIARRRVTRRTVGVLAAALGLVLFVGGFVFYNTNVLNAYQTSAGTAQRQAEYERLYGRYEDVPQPQLTATELHVEIYPEGREADIRGIHHLVNRTLMPIDTIHLAISSLVETGEIEFSRPARAALVDDELGHRIYVLEEPLQPNDSLHLSWQVRYDPRGFPARGISTDVVGNGSFIVMHGWIPLIGYQPSRELSKAGERREHGLAARPTVPALDDLEARRDRTGHERFDLEVTIGTAADQIAVAPGELLRTWTQNGRSYFQYATAAPIGSGYAIFCADYTVRRARWGDVTLEVVHHPAHDLNVQRMIRSMEVSLEQYTERFGPYPHKVLRMVEYPAAGGALHAATGTIWYQELFSLFDTDHDERRIDLPFAVVAHEVAHQWWGGKLAPAHVEGRALLSESLAWYSAMGVIGQEYGTEHLARFLDFMRRDYLTPRARAGVPLLRATDYFLAYRKGPFAMYALREYVGQDIVDLALRRLLAQHEPPFATSLDLYRELQKVTPDSLQYLIGDLFERNTFWELEARQATAQQTPGGEWRVSLDVVARKVVVDTAGSETDIAMNDLVEIGVFALPEAGEPRGKPLYLAMHRIRTGPQTITITVPQRPARAGLDPRHLLIDVEPDDNLADIPEASPSKD